MAQLPPKIPNITPHWPDFSSQNLDTTVTTAVQNLSWVDEFLDFSATHRGNHRRSVSDSIALLEDPIITGNDSIGSHQFDRFDDEQFMSMFIVDGDPNNNPTGSSSNTSTPSDHNSINDDKKEPPSNHNI